MLAIALRDGPAQFVPTAAGRLAFVEDHVWIASLNIHYRMGVDGIALALILLTALLTPLAILALVGRDRPPGEGLLPRAAVPRDRA